MPAGVSGIFIKIKYHWSHYGPGDESCSKKNKYQEYVLV